MNVHKNKKTSDWILKNWKRFGLLDAARCRLAANGVINHWALLRRFGFNQSSRLP